MRTASLVSVFLVPASWETCECDLAFGSIFTYLMDISPELMNTDQPEALKKPTQVGERVHHDDRSFVPKSLAEGKEVANHARTKHTITPTNSDLVVVFEKWENNERKW